MTTYKLLNTLYIYTLVLLCTNVGKSSFIKRRFKRVLPHSLPLRPPPLPPLSLGQVCEEIWVCGDDRLWGPPDMHARIVLESGTHNPWAIKARNVEPFEGVHGVVKRLRAMASEGRVVGAYAVHAAWAPVLKAAAVGVTTASACDAALAAADAVLAPGCGLQELACEVRGTVLSTLSTIYKRPYSPHQPTVSTTQRWYSTNAVVVVGPQPLPTLVPHSTA